MVGTPKKIVVSRYVAAPANAQEISIHIQSSQSKQLALIGLHIAPVTLATFPNQIVIFVAADQEAAFDPAGFAGLGLISASPPVEVEYLAKTQMEIKYTNKDIANPHPFTLLAVYELREKEGKGVDC